MTQLDFMDPDNTVADATPEDTNAVFGTETPSGGHVAGTDSGANGGEVSEDSTGPAPLVEPASTDAMDDPQQTDISGYPTTEAQVVPLHLFATLEDLCAPTDWGDVLRLVNFRRDLIRLTMNQEGSCRLLLCNSATGMWRIQGDPSFQSLFDVILSEANEEALQLVENDPTTNDRVRGRLRRHIESSSGGSVTKALKRCGRVADDPCVPIDRVDPSVLNPVDRHPVILCEHDLVNLNDRMVADPLDLKHQFLLDMAPAPTAFVRDDVDGEAPGAVMMHRFLTYLGNGDEAILCQRLGWQLCGHHQTIDVIAGDCDALTLLGQALQETLGPSGARTLSMVRGAVTARHVADMMERTRLCLWMGADTARTLPVWELHSLVSDPDARRQGNIVLAVAHWPTDWETLDQRIAGKCDWAWRIQERLADQGIDPDVALNQDGRQYLLAKLVEGAAHGYQQFQTTKEQKGIGDPGQVASDEYSQACAEEMRVAGANHEHRILYRALQFTDEVRDAMTMADIDDAVTAIGAEPIQHHVIGKMLRRMWPDVESVRDRIDGTQTRIVRRIAQRVHQ